MKAKSYALHPHGLKDHGLKFGHYYVAEVSFRPSNPIHRYIAHSARALDRGVALVELAGALDPEDRLIRLDQVAFFRVVQDITAMVEPCSRSMPPSFYGDKDEEAEPAP